MRRCAEPVWQDELGTWVKVGIRDADGLFIAVTEKYGLRAAYQVFHVCCRSGEVLHHAGTCLENNGIRREGKSGRYVAQQTETCLPTEQRGSLALTQLFDLLSPLLSSPLNTVHSSARFPSYFSGSHIFYQLLPLLYLLHLFLPSAVLDLFMSEGTHSLVSY